MVVRFYIRVMMKPRKYLFLMKFRQKGSGTPSASGELFYIRNNKKFVW